MENKFATGMAFRDENMRVLYIARKSTRVLIQLGSVVCRVALILGAVFVLTACSETDGVKSAGSSTGQGTSRDDWLKELQNRCPQAERAISRHEGVVEIDDIVLPVEDPGLPRSEFLMRVKMVPIEHAPITIRFRKLASGELVLEGVRWKLPDSNSNLPCDIDKEVKMEIDPSAVGILGSEFEERLISHLQSSREEVPIPISEPRDRWYWDVEIDERKESFIDWAPADPLLEEYWEWLVQTSGLGS